MGKKYSKKYKINKNKTKTRKKIKNKIKYGGETNYELRENQRFKNLFRRGLTNNIIQINNKKNIKQAINSIINLFKNNPMINTLIPVTQNGKPVDKETYKSKTPIFDFVSPVSVILDNLIDISESDLIKILNAYYYGGGNFNNLSSRFKITPIENEINRGNIKNIEILLNKTNPFHVIEEGLDEETKTKLNDLIPNNKEIILLQEQPKAKQTTLNTKLNLSYELPENNDIGYDKMLVPEFWKPIFNHENNNELLIIRDKFMGIYQYDKYTNDNQKQILICNLLEKIIPGYFTKYVLDYREIPKTLINVNILNCFITLLYGLILYKLYDTKQDYLFIFKGGRALQLGLTDIDNIDKYYSEDTDILIIPNKVEGSVYDKEKMENLSCHIGYLVKWMIPEEINVIVSLPTNPKNTNKDITKLIYNDNKIFKALSDIGFGDISEDINIYFQNLIYSPIYVDEFEEVALFIFPNLDDMLGEKLYYYIKYYYLREKLKKNEPITDKKYLNMTIDEYDFLLYKFSRSINKLIEAIIKKEYINAVDYNKKEASKIIMRGILSSFNDYSNEEKENVISAIIK
jgi:hypothetical protein